MSPTCEEGVDPRSPATKWAWRSFDNSLKDVLERIPNEVTWLSQLIRLRQALLKTRLPSAIYKYKMGSGYLKI